MNVYTVKTKFCLDLGNLFFLDRVAIHILYIAKRMGGEASQSVLNLCYDSINSVNLGSFNFLILLSLIKLG